jgi:hypothetical protein
VAWLSPSSSERCHRGQEPPTRASAKRATIPVWRGSTADGRSHRAFPAAGDPKPLRAAVASGPVGVELKPEVTVMQRAGSIALGQAAGVRVERRCWDWHAVVLRDGRSASRVQHSAAADVAAPSRGRC